MLGACARPGRDKNTKRCHLPLWGDRSTQECPKKMHTYVLRLRWTTRCTWCLQRLRQGGYRPCTGSPHHVCLRGMNNAADELINCAIQDIFACGGVLW